MFGVWVFVGMVCLFLVWKGIMRIFSDLLVENIDVDFQSSQSTTSLHDIAAYINQDPTRNNEGQSREHFSLNQSVSKLKRIHDWYIEVPPCNLPNDTPTPVCSKPSTTDLSYLANISRWVQVCCHHQASIGCSHKIQKDSSGVLAIGFKTVDELFLCQTLESCLLEMFRCSQVMMLQKPCMFAK